MLTELWTSPKLHIITLWNLVHNWLIQALNKSQVSCLWTSWHMFILSWCKWHLWDKVCCLVVKKNIKHARTTNQIYFSQLILLHILLRRFCNKPLPVEPLNTQYQSARIGVRPGAPTKMADENHPAWITRPNTHFRSNSKLQMMRRLCVEHTTMDMVIIKKMA